SSTLAYDADNFFQWVQYFSRFCFLGWFDLSRYFYKREKFKLMRDVLFGHLFYLALILWIASFNLPAAVIVFIIPTAFCWFAMLSGNWAQHAFIDCSKPTTPTTMSITCIKSLYNKDCFND